MIPNGRRLKQYLPKGVIKVVSNADSSDSLICQNPELASSLENTFAPPSCANVCSTEGRMCRSLLTLSLSLVRSTQIRTLSAVFGTTTIPAHQSVGSSTFEMTPNSSIRCNSDLTLGSSGIATLLGVESAKGFASSFSWIW